MSTVAVQKDSGKTSKRGAAVATAIHAKTGDNHIVGIGNLRVVIIQDGKFWFAQGLEIDYAAEGSSPEEVKKTFEEGLCGSIHEHLRVYGTIEKFLIPAPSELWKELLFDPIADVNRYSQLSWHEELSEKPMPNLPFERINYLQRKAA